MSMRLLNIIVFLGACLSTVNLFSQDFKKELPLSFSVTVTNSLDVDRKNEMVSISEADLQKTVPTFNAKAFVVFDNGKEIASQYGDNGLNNKSILVVLDAIKAKETRELIIRYKKTGELKRNYVKRAQAELSHKVDGAWEGREYKGGVFKNVTSMRVPPQHKDHSWFIRYEGPGWESDKVGYRFYLDQRNATDVFGKTTPEMVLQKIGLDGFDSYHNLQSWGMDVMKVGRSLGVGSLGAIRNNKVSRVEKTDSLGCQILENGNLYASILTDHYGWKVSQDKVDVKSLLSIHAGTSLTTQQFYLSSDMDSLGTGIVKDKNAKLFANRGNESSCGYLATFGKQSLNNDALGLAVFFNPSDATTLSDDADSHIVVLRSKDRVLKYWFLAEWSGEPNGIQDESAFLEYVRVMAQKIANPLVVNITK